MKSLSEFGNEKIEQDKIEQDAIFDEKNIRNTYEKYKDLPEDELLKTFLKEVENQKSNGTFNYENLKSLVDSMAPMLSTEQLFNINTLLEKIK